MAQKKFFVGFSTVGTSNSRSWAMYDIALIKQDLLNHFHTRKGDRVMRPSYGCSIWDYIGEQMTASLEEEIIEEAERIVALDSRVSSRGIRVDTHEHGYTLHVNLYYQAIDTVDAFKISFDKRQ